MEDCATCMTDTIYLSVLLINMYNYCLDLLVNEQCIHKKCYAAETNQKDCHIYLANNPKTVY